MGGPNAVRLGYDRNVADDPYNPHEARSPHATTMSGAPRSLRSPTQMELDAATELTPGIQVTNLKAYEIVERLGEGGMGKIYKAYDPIMDRYVALKVLKLDVPETERRRFRREAVIAANFSHPNLVRVLDVGKIGDQGVEWMSMEYLRGRDLGEVVDRQKRARIPVLVDIFRQTLDALDYIHVRRIVHCDIKPDNIFITRDNYNRRIVIVKLIDFGIARNLDPPLELQKQITGDPRYMAPEQAVLNGPIDHRADLYALGMTFYEVLTGRHPFDEIFDGPVSALLEAHRRRMPPPPSVFIPGMPGPLLVAIDSFFTRACDKDPARRFPDAMMMREALMQLLALDTGA